MIARLRNILFPAVLLASLTVTAAGQRGAIVASRNLAQLTLQAETIVVAHVAFARVEPHPQFHNLHTVVVTLRISETIKGLPLETLTFRQYIWDPRDIADNAAYRRGDEVLLMLNRTNEYELTSPVGLNQGRFEIQRDGSGKAWAMNGYRNERLFSEMNPETSGLSARARSFVAHAPAQGAVALDDLRQTIRDLVAAQAGVR